MIYQHTGKSKVVMKHAVFDPDSTDWVFFIYQDWIREGEIIVSHSTVNPIGCTIETDSSNIGDLNIGGTDYTNVYAVQVKPIAGSQSLSITHRVSTTTTGVVDLARLNIDHSVEIPISEL